MNIPATLTAGDSATWTDTPFTDSQGGNYDSSAYSLRYEIRGPGPALTLNSIAGGRGWSTSITTTQSAGLVPAGKWGWAAYASKAGGRVTVGTGTLVVAADLTAAGTAAEVRTQNEQDLDAVRAEIRGRVLGGMTQEYTIGSRQLKKEATSVLLELESRLVRMVAGEKAAANMANGLGNPRQINVRFSGVK